MEKQEYLLYCHGGTSDKGDIDTFETKLLMSIIYITFVCMPIDQNEGLISCPYLNLSSRIRRNRFSYGVGVITYVSS